MREGGNPSSMNGTMKCRSECLKTRLPYTVARHPVPIRSALLTERIQYSVDSWWLPCVHLCAAHQARDPWFPSMHFFRAAPQARRAPCAMRATHASSILRSTCPLTPRSLVLVTIADVLVVVGSGGSFLAGSRPIPSRAVASNSGVASKSARIVSADSSSRLAAR